jgi:hypothetical protein
MRKPLVLRSSVESVFSGIGTGCGDPFDIGSSGDEADDALPLMSFRKRAEANVTHRLPLEARRSAPAKPRPRAKQYRQRARPPPGDPKDGRGGSAVWSRAFGSEPSRCRDMLFRKIHNGMDFRRPIRSYYTKAICAVSIMSA